MLEYNVLSSFFYLDYAEHTRIMAQVGIFAHPVTGNVGMGTTAPRRRLDVQGGDAIVSGNIGIGTTNPLKPLHVIGDIFATGTLTASNVSVIGDFVTLNTVTSNTEQMVITNAGTGPGLKVTQTGAEAIAEFYDDGGVLAMKVADGGNVGIGTANPLYRLHIVDSVSTIGTAPLLCIENSKGNHISSILKIIDSDTADGASKTVVSLDTSTGQGLFNLVAGAENSNNTYIYGSTRGASRIGLHDNTINFFTSTLGFGSGVQGSAVTWNNPMSIRDTGYVGIGTIWPKGALDVNGRIYSSDQIYVNNKALVGCACRAIATTEQSIANNTNTKLVFQQVTFDTHTAFNLSTSRFTPTISGYYQVNAAVRFSGSVACVVGCYIYINGTIYSGTNLQRNGNSTGATVSDIVLLNGSTDYIEIYVFQNSGAAVNTLTTDNFTASNTAIYFSASMILSG